MGVHFYNAVKWYSANPREEDKMEMNVMRWQKSNALLMRFSSPLSAEFLVFGSKPLCSIWVSLLW